MTADVPEMLADPVGVIVAMIRGVEPSLELKVIEDAVISVAGGRAKRRKLAQALARRPAVLADGRSPAPRAAGDLLVALRKAGAGAVSPPVCAGCGKQLRSFQRRGEDWFCCPGARLRARHDGRLRDCQVPLRGLPPVGAGVRAEPDARAPRGRRRRSPGPLGEVTRRGRALPR
jgi:hypothetical protein